jgi:hypothetical protein
MHINTGHQVHPGGAPDARQTVFLYLGPQARLDKGGFAGPGFPADQEKPRLVLVQAL